MKLLLVVNPFASSVTEKNRARVHRALGADHDVEAVETASRGHATSLAREGAERGAQVVVVLGGDGTVNEAANGVVGTDAVLAALPGGSTNVFSRTIGVAKEPVKAAHQLCRALSERAWRAVNLGSVNGRYFLFHVGMGYDAQVVAQVERRAKLKRSIGQAVFVYAALATWARHYDRSRPRLAVRFEDGGSVDDGYFAICLNSDPYTFLGPRPLSVAPGTGLDGRLAMVTLRSLQVGPLLGAVGSALGRGGYLARSPHVDRRSDLAWVEVAGHGPFPYQVDGDHLGDTEHLRFEHHPDALTLVIPPA